MRVRCVLLLCLFSACRDRIPDPGCPTTVGDAVTPVDRCTAPSPLDDATLTRETDLVYRQAGSNFLALDIYRDRNALAPPPAVLLIHGGGWSDGDKIDLETLARTVAGAGLGAVPVNFRLARGDATRFPTQLDDLRCAVRWLRQNGAAHGLSVDTISVLGTSTGAHLAALLGAVAAVDFDASIDGNCDSTASARVDRVVAYSGIYDLRYSNGLSDVMLNALAPLIGGAPEQNPMLAAFASPLFQVRSTSAPTLFVHGTANGIVSVDDARLALATYRFVCLPSTLIEVQNADENLTPLSAADGSRAATCTVLSFLKPAP